MNTVIQGLAQNNYVLSVANLGGIIAFLVLLYGFGRAAHRFAKTAYRENIRAAVHRARRRNFIQAKRCALDLHTFISAIVIYGIMVVLAAMACVVGVVAWGTHYTLPPEQTLSSFLHISPTWDTITGAVMLYAPLILLLLAVTRLAKLASNTRRVRVKLVLRKLRRSREEGN
jgi:hypothetical protein